MGEEDHNNMDVAYKVPPVVFLAGASVNFMSETTAFCANKPDGRTDDGRSKGERRH